VCITTKAKPVLQKQETKKEGEEAPAEGEGEAPVKDSESNDQHLSFVEFLDFLLRLFHAFFSDSMHPMVDKKYHEQIKYGLDLLFTAYKDKIHGHGDPEINVISAEEIKKLQDQTLEDEIYIRILEL
jgi:hypothetical protein